MKHLPSIILGIFVVGLIAAWRIDNSNSKAKLREMTEEHKKVISGLQEHIDSLVVTNDYLEQRAKDQKKQLNETKQQITNVTVVDYTTIEPDARADSIRAIINR